MMIVHYVMMILCHVIMIVHNVMMIIRNDIMIVYNVMRIVLYVMMVLHFFLDGTSLCDNTRGDQNVRGLAL